MKTKTLTYGNATIVIHRPELTEAEQAKSERQLLIALQQFGKAMQESKKERFTK